MDFGFWDCDNSHYIELSIPLYRGMLLVGGSQDQIVLVMMLWVMLNV